MSQYTQSSTDSYLYAPHQMELNPEAVAYKDGWEFQPISPQLHPTNPDAWLDDIPIHQEGKRQEAALRW